MADRARYPGQSGGSVGREYVEIKLKLNGASAPTVLSGSGYLSQTAPPAHAGGGNIITFTMRDAWLEVIAHAVDVRDDAGNGAYATIGTFANEQGQAGGTKTGVTGTAGTPLTFKVQTFTSGGAAANDSTLIIAVMLALRNSSEAYGN